MKVKKYDPKRMKITGRVRPFVIGVLLLISGLLMDKWWWKVGGIILLIIFVQASYRYRPINLILIWHRLCN